MNKNDFPQDVTRRDFLKGGSFAAIMAMLGGVPLRAQPAPVIKAEEDLAVSPVNVAVIGLGAWGREILATLGALPQANIVAVCDNYAPWLRRSASATPDAKAVDDHRRILDDKEIKAVIIATPSHTHCELALAALQAGKHVYCETPLASTVEEARNIALAARDARNQVFQSGLQFRSDPQRYFLLEFIRSGAMGRNIKVRSQWHKKQSWRQAAPTADREKELNWRLNSKLSSGLLGEIGIHQLDAANWILNRKPTAVTGFGSLILWTDGRDVPDTVQAVFDYPRGVRFSYEASLATSFDGDFEMYYGTDSAILIRGSNAWMFKEADAPLLGWEVYARKDDFHNQPGIVLVANASKLEGQDAEAAQADTKSPLHHALEAFLYNASEVQDGIDEFVANFGADDEDALADYLTGLKRLPAAGYLEGFEAAITAIKANEAVLKGEKLTFEKEWFEL